MGRGSKEMVETWGNCPSCPKKPLTERKTFGVSVCVVTTPTYFNPDLTLGESTQAIMLLTITRTVNFKLVVLTYVESVRNICDVN